MNPFNLGPFELVFVLIVLLLLFGAKRLPELGSGLGKGIREFKRSMNDMRSEIDRVGDEPNKIHQPPPSGTIASGAAGAAPRQPAETKRDEEDAK